MAYIGREPQIGNFQVCDAISVVNGQAAYTMQVNSVNVVPETAFHVLCSLNGVLQKPGSSFSVSGSTITFASNLVTNDVIDFIQILGSTLDLGVPSDDTVSTAKIQDNAITAAKFASGVGGKILQVVQTTKTDTFTSGSSNAWIDVTGLSAAITPASTSNKILVHLTMGAVSIGSANSFGFKLVRGSTDISIGDASSSRKQASIWNYDGSSNRAQSEACSFLDSPSSTSEQTYKVQMYANATAYVNRMSGDSDNDVYGRTASSIILMEVSA